ncbi:MAG: hypothetical protein LUG62_00815 [Clostridiales bacterium]|nr:hypothetical protein [Clostridiales bacterium]
MKRDCDNCKWADVSSGPRVIEGVGVILVQEGSNNYNCLLDGRGKNVTMTITDEEITCSAFEPKEKIELH